MSEDAAAKTLREQLEIMKQTTRMTGALHEFQVHQIRMWVILACPGVERSTLKWDANNKTLVVNVRYGDLGGCDAPQLEESVTARLGGWVKELLGEGWTLTIKRGKKEIFSS